MEARGKKKPVPIIRVQLDRRPDPDTGHEGRRTQKRGSRKPLAARGLLCGDNHELALKYEEGAGYSK